MKDLNINPTNPRSKLSAAKVHADHARDLTDVTCPICLEYRSLNAETIKAIEDARAGIGVTSY
ncbi:MAG: hypothetical protein QM523_05145 [Candidatus Pacebacteria bacterium]|nr:hypothetical protein [Candidatus Paceibacterota bacterium]